ncbi:MAG: carboxypeptidase-like regulatory domain-containing protein [Bacteroidota bacterium]
MTEILIYLAKSSFILTAFYLCYRLILTKDTHYAFRRSYLLLAGLLALIIPLIPISYVEYQSWEGVLTTMDFSIEKGELLSPSITVDQAWTWMDYLGFFYVLGCAIMFLRLFWIGLQLGRLFSKASFKTIEGKPIAYSEDIQVPFSFFNYIFFPAFEEGKNPNQVILTHEGLHIKKRHSWDVLLAELLLLFFWFNPVSWLFKQALQEVHEYQVDAHILESGFDKKSYQLLLLNYSVGKQKIVVANSFNHLTTRKRISMMNKEKSPKPSRLKYLSFLPLLFLSLTFLSAEPLAIESSIAPTSEEGLILVGKILDVEKEEAVIGATVLVEGSQLGTFTDQKGMFKLRIPDKSEVSLQIAYVGKETYKVSISKSGELTVYLGEEGVEGKHRFEAKDISLADKEMEVSGTKLKLNFDKSLKPESQPLFVIDGVIEEDINSLDPKDIKNIDVLKGEKAIAIYGDKGENGVIVVTTKKK